MAMVMLVRHARSSANTSGVLAGRAPGVHLDDLGRSQAAALGERLAGARVVRVVSSPLERCQETAEPILRASGLGLELDERLVECGYGTWTGRKLRELARDPLWKVVQAHPSAVRFPDGESFGEMQSRAVSAIRQYDAEVEAKDGPHATWVAMSHADVIKSVLADALGQHLDLFQRIVVDPCSVSLVRFTPLRPFVLRMNDDGSSLAAMLAVGKPQRRGRRATQTAAGATSSSDAAVGGGAGGLDPSVPGPHARAVGTAVVERRGTALGSAP